MKNTSVKNDFLDNKLRWDLLPLEEVEDIVKVFTAGANKYGDNNWQHLENGYQRYKAAMFRHLLEYEKGTEFDGETGCRHLAQVAWNAMAMLYLSKHKDTVNNLKTKLDKAIEDKINNCNDILDSIQNIYSNNEITRRDAFNHVGLRYKSEQTLEEKLIELAHVLIYDINDSTGRFRFSYNIVPIFNVSTKSNEFDLKIYIEDRLYINPVKDTSLDDTGYDITEDSIVLKKLEITEHIATEEDIANIEKKFTYFNKFKACSFADDVTELMGNVKELFNVKEDRKVYEEIGSCNKVLNEIEFFSEDPNSSNYKNKK